MHLVELYVNDLGNGHSKRTLDGKTVYTDPSVVARVPADSLGTNGANGLDNIVRTGREVYIGLDAVNSGQTPYPALGEMDRYEKPEFEELLLGFMTKDIGVEDTLLNHLLLGVPVNHYEQCKEKIETLYSGKKVVKVNGGDVLFNIKQVTVIPQPLGTYNYLVKRKLIDPSGRYLIVDGGEGTLDVTEMYGHNVVSFGGENLGMRKAHRKIQQFLQRKFGELGFAINNIPTILADGFTYDGGKISVAEIPEVITILDNHFDDGNNFIIERFDITRIKTFNGVIFTGGWSLAHAKRINLLNWANGMILDNAQVANSIGFHDLGIAVMKSGTSSSV